MLPQYRRSVPFGPPSSYRGHGDKSLSKHVMLGGVLVLFTLINAAISFRECAEPAGAHTTAPRAERSVLLPPSRPAYATLVTDEGYVRGAQVLARSIVESGSKVPMVCMVTRAVGSEARMALKESGFDVREVAGVRNPSMDHLARASFAETYTKLRVWELTDFDRVVFLDADMLVVKNIDELFDHARFAVSMDCCDYFNTGLMVLAPSQVLFDEMMAKLDSLFSYDGGDQGFLNSLYQKDFTRLPYIYNAIQTDYFINKSTWDLAKIKVVHYVRWKPWHDTRISELAELHQLWQKVHAMVEHPFELPEEAPEAAAGMRGPDGPDGDADANDDDDDMLE